MPTTTNGGASGTASGASGTASDTASGASGATGKVAHPLVARRLTVADVTDLGAGLRRIVLDGPDAAGIVALGVTDHVKLFVPARPGADVVHPRVVDGAWLDKRDPALTYREMTVRTHVPGGPLVLEIVAGDHGPASRWAAQAQVGQEVGVLGPKSSAPRPLDRPRYVLAVDATGLPAIRNWLDRLPASAQVTILAQVAGAAGGSGERVVARTATGAAAAPSASAGLPLPSRPGVDIVQLDPTDDGALATAVERLVAETVGGAGATAVGGVGTFWWAAAEAAQVRRIRAALVGAGVPRDSWAMTAYWRRGVAHFDHKSPDA